MSEKPVKAPPKVIRSLREMIRDCTHTVTKQELNLDQYGAALRSLREDRDISLRDMAKRIGISAPFLSDCELGNRRLKLSHQVKFVTECLKS